MVFVQFAIFTHPHLRIIMENTNTATVVKHTGSHYMLSKLPQWELFPAVIKGKLRLKGFNSTNPIAVGDLVEYEGGEGGLATIKSILPRKNHIIRK